MSQGKKHSAASLRAFAKQVQNAKHGDVLQLNGRPVPVISPDLATKNDVLVRMRGTVSPYFPASETTTGTCAQCNHAIHWMKTAPTAPTRICGNCAETEMNRHPEQWAIPASK